MTKLSDTQRVILSRAAQHDALLATPPAKLPAAARQAVLRSMIAKGLLEEVPAPREAIALGWRQDEDGAWIALRITAAGLAAIGVEPETATGVADAELGGLAPAEFEEEQELAQAALDAGIDLSLGADDDARATSATVSIPAWSSATSPTRARMRPWRPRETHWRRFRPRRPPAAARHRKALSARP